MAGFNFSQNIIGLNKTNGDIHELEVEVANLSASVLSIAGDVDELELSVADLSASILSINTEIENIRSSDVIFTPAEGFIVFDFMGKESQNEITGHISVTGSTTASTWTTVGTINKTPSISYVTPLVNSTDGSYCGMLRIGESGNVGVYTTSSLTSTNMNTTFIYETTN